MQAIDSDSRNGRLQIRGTPPTRDDMLTDLAELIELAKTKGTNGRIKEPKNEKIKQDWIKTAIHGIHTYLLGLRDRQLEELDKRLEVLEHAKQST